MQGAIFGLIGVILGATLSWIVAALGERSRRKHEGRRLVRVEKLEAYAAFSAGAKDYVAVLYRVAAHAGWDDSTEKISLSKAEPLLVAAFGARDQAFERIRLVGSDESISCARSWVTVIYELRNSLNSSKLDRSGWSDLVRRANQARDAFHEQARRELAV